MRADWTNFFIGDVAAAASLSALLFVAISLRPAEIQATIGIFARARAAFFLFGAALVVGLINLSPVPPWYAAIAQAVTCGFLFAISVPFTLANYRAGVLRGNTLRVAVYYSTLALIALSGLFVAGGHAGALWQALQGAAILVALALGMNNAWVLVLSHRR